MPRTKKNNPTRYTPEPTSDDVPVSVTTEESVGEVVTMPPVADAPEVVVDGQVAPETVKEKKVGPKAARRAKTCEKCLQRREREREYARAARLKSRAAKEAKSAAAVSAAAASTTPEVVEVDVAPVSTA